MPVNTDILFSTVSAFNGIILMKDPCVCTSSSCAIRKTKRRFAVIISGNFDEPLRAHDTGNFVALFLELLAGSAGFWYLELDVHLPLAFSPHDANDQATLTKCKVVALEGGIILDARNFARAANDGDGALCGFKRHI